jgi:uncharacterized MnhB-related membrane protein
MTSRLILYVLLLVTAGYALTRRRRLDAIIGMAAFSLLLASVFFLSHAPDVAITEAAVGAALVTFIYVLAIRKTGRLTVAASEVPGLMERTADRITGLEFDILERLANGLGLDLTVVFLERGEVEDVVLRGDADIGAGGLIASDSDERLLLTRGYLPTARFLVSSKGPEGAVSEPKPFRGFLSDVIDAVRRRESLSVTLDLARFLALSRQNLEAYDVTRTPGELTYAFVTRRSRADLQRRLQALLEDLADSGELDRMARRYFP